MRTLVKIAVLCRAVLDVWRVRTLLACCCLVAVHGITPGNVTWADAPEQKVWSDSPQKSELSQIGPQNRPVELTRYQHVRYVSQTTGSDGSGDGSLCKPWASVNHAIAQITYAGPARRYAILVSKGTYGGATIQMKEYVDLFGSFEPVRWQRDVFAHCTVLDGQGDGRVLEAANNTRLDGFVVTGGKVQGHGAGILCHRTSPIIANNTIISNSTSEPVGFVHDPARRRHVGNDGGGIACVDGANPLIAHNIIFNNTTEVGNGGGIACRNDACPKIIYNVIWGNRAGLADVHKTRSGNGGGISCFVGAPPVINNNLIANNHAGGGSDGGAVYCEYDSSPQVYFNYLLGNRAEDDGGGIESMKTSYPHILANFIAGNQAGNGGGGGICISDDGLAQIIDNVIVRNSGLRKAGGVACSNGWMALKNNIIVDNTSPWPNDVLYYNDNRPYLAPPVIAKNIVWNNAHIPFDPNLAGVFSRFDSIQEEYSSNRNVPRAAGFFEYDGLRLTASEMTHRPKSFATAISVPAIQFDKNALAGRVVRIGSVWSLVKSNTSQELIVWGKLGGESVDIEILPKCSLPFQFPETDRDGGNNRADQS